jgi:hypothetical protein
MIFHANRFEIVRQKPLVINVRSDIKSLTIKVLYSGRPRTPLKRCSNHPNAFPFLIHSTGEYEYEWKSDCYGHHVCTFSKDKTIFNGSSLSLQFVCGANEKVHKSKENNRLWKLVISYETPRNMKITQEFPIQVHSKVGSLYQAKKIKKEVQVSTNLDDPNHQEVQVSTNLDDPNHQEVQVLTNLDDPNHQEQEQVESEPSIVKPSIDILEKAIKETLQDDEMVDNSIFVDEQRIFFSPEEMVKLNDFYEMLEPEKMVNEELKPEKFVFSPEDIEILDDLYEMLEPKNFVNDVHM